MEYKGHKEKCVRVPSFIHRITFCHMHFQLLCACTLLVWILRTYLFYKWGPRSLLGFIITSTSSFLLVEYSSLQLHSVTTVFTTYLHSLYTYTLLCKWNDTECVWQQTKIFLLCLISLAYIWASSFVAISISPKIYILKILEYEMVIQGLLRLMNYDECMIIS